MRKDAPELVRVAITGIQTTSERRQPRGCPRGSSEMVRSVIAKGKVLDVVRSKSKLRRNDPIRITYTSIDHCPGWAGPSKIRALKRGQKVYAYLLKERTGYKPAAGSASFPEKLP
jgi:hypothetical protein